MNNKQITNIYIIYYHGKITRVIMEAYNHKSLFIILGMLPF